VTYHGNVDQQTLARHYKECCVCLYPSDFIETFAITMTEAACGGAYIIVRDVGAMKDTLTWAKALHGCEFLDCNCETKEEYAAYHASLVHAMSYRLWEKAGIDPETVSWESIAKTWLAELL
jgi:glycosyltransferase involved in cell wall biosynthesis